MQRTSLYDEDILLWSEQQAEALRQLRHLRNVPAALDLENVVEEIESAGNEQLYVVESRLRLILGHLIKRTCEPMADATPHWRSEIMNWHGDLLNRYAPSMAGHLDMDRVWRRALRQTIGSTSARQRNVPSECPFGLAELLNEDLEIEPLIARLGTLLDPPMRP